MQNIYIEDKNLSFAWVKAFLETINSSGGEISPLIVKVNGFNDGKAYEDNRIRELINNHKKLKNKFNISKDYIETVAGTIFPQSLWNKNKERSVLYDRFRKIYPLMKKIRANWFGMYFNRLISFDNGDKKPIRQLEKIICAGIKNTRRSALQAAIFDPRKDHRITNRQLGFPCLQQIAFTAVGEQGLRITGFYAKQLIFEKAYGNYLGLSRLGDFMAKEMGLRLKEMLCIASVASYAKCSKQDLKPLEFQLQKII